MHIVNIVYTSVEQYNVVQLERLKRDVNSGLMSRENLDYGL